MSTLPETRKRLVETRITLRQANDHFAQSRAEAEQRAIDAAGGEKSLGANEEARKRALTLVLAKDDDYQLAVTMIRQMEATVDRLEAEMEDLRDARREEEWRIRLRLADALDRRGIRPDAADTADDRAAFDASADEAATARIVAAQRSRSQLGVLVGAGAPSVLPPAVTSDGDDDLPF